MSHVFRSQIEVRLVLFINHCFRCKYHAGTIGSGQTVELSCSEAISGRYVYVTLRITEYLTLCEVEVFEDKGNVLLLFVGFQCLVFGNSDLHPSYIKPYYVN